MAKETLACFVILLVVSCTEGQRHRDVVTFDGNVDSSRRVSILVSDAELQESSKDDRVDELFDDFLYSYVHDKDLQHQRTIFPLCENFIDGTQRCIEKEQWTEEFKFMKGEYSTNFYTSEQEKVINENTSLGIASLERIDLDNRNIIIYDFVRNEHKWQLSAIQHKNFAESDMGDFLDFYHDFVYDTKFQYRSLARSIRISMMDPDDDSQNIDGFITRNQWAGLSGGLPQGIITNIRYGQHFSDTKTILLEKVSMGDGMSETFTFSLTGQGWKLIGYDN